MAVTSCTLDRNTRKATVDELNIGTYTLRYIVETDSTMGPIGVTNGALASSPHPLPSQWTSYSYQGDADPLSFAREYDIEGDPGVLRRWYITVSFRPLDKGEGAITEDGSPSPIMAQPNPVERKPVMWWDRQAVSETFTTDIFGKAIVNKCKDLYPDEVQLDISYSILVVEFNVETLNQVFDITRAYDGAVNKTEWDFGGYTFPPRTVLIKEVCSGPPQTEQGYTFFHIVMRIAFGADPSTLEEGQSDDAKWDYPITEMGQYHWTKTAGEYDVVGSSRKITDAGKYIFLDSDGTRKDDTEDAVTTRWRIRREVDFSPLPITDTGV